MNPSIKSLVIAVFVLVPAVLCGQEVNVRVDPVDLTVRSRVQKEEQPDSPLLPGGSIAWTGQPIMSQVQSSNIPAPTQKSGSMSKAGQFPTVVGTSVWAPSSIAAASSVAAASPADTNGVQDRPQATTKRWTKALTSRKLTLMAAAEAQSAKLARTQEDPSLSLEQTGPSDLNFKLRKLKQATNRAARLRMSRSLQAKGDASTTATHWGADQSSSNALWQQQHESGMLLHYGFNARSDRIAKRRKLHRHRTGSNPSSR